MRIKTVGQKMESVDRYRTSSKSRWVIFLLLLVGTNLATYFIARSGPYTPATETISSTTKYRAGLNHRNQRGEELLGGANRALKADPLTRSRLSEARSLFFQPEQANQPPEISVLSSTGRLATGAAEAADLTPDERVNVQDAFDDAFSEAEIDFMNRAVLDESKSDPESGIFVFGVPAAADRGSAILLKLHDDLRALLGGARAELLCRSYDPTQFRGGFGQSDMECTIYTPVSEVGAGSTRVHYKMSNPEGGNIHTTAEMTFEAFTEQFGKVFMVQDDDQRRPAE